MGCKEPEACIANKRQNFVGSWKSWQCRPWNWTKVWLIPYYSLCITCAAWVMRSFRLGHDFKSSNTCSRALQRVDNAVPNQIANLKWDVSNQLQFVTGDLIYWNKTIFYENVILLNLLNFENTFHRHFKLLLATDVSNRFNISKFNNIRLEQSIL